MWGAGPQGAGLMQLEGGEAAVRGVWSASADVEGQRCVRLRQVRCTIVTGHVCACTPVDKLHHRPLFPGTLAPW